MDKKVKKIGVRYVLAWIFGVLAILSGAGYLTINILAGLIILLAGVIILPPFGNFVEKKFNIRLSGWLLFVVFLILLGIGGSLVQSDKQKSTNLPTSPQVTVEKPTETKTPSEEVIGTPRKEEREKEEITKDTTPKKTPFNLDEARKKAIEFINDDYSIEELTKFTYQNNILTIEFSHSNWVGVILQKSIFDFLKKEANYIKDIDIKPAIEITTTSPMGGYMRCKTEWVDIVKINNLEIGYSDWKSKASCSQDGLF